MSSGRVIELRRLRWAVHVRSIRGMRNAYKYSVGKPLREETTWKSQVGEDNIKIKFKLK
jgi:hypothetical protein